MRDRGKACQIEQADILHIGQRADDRERGAGRDRRAAGVIGDHAADAPQSRRDCGIERELVLRRSAALHQCGLIAESIGIDDRDITGLIADKRERELRGRSVAERDSLVRGAVDGGDGNQVGNADRECDGDYSDDQAAEHAHHGNLLTTVGPRKIGHSSESRLISNSIRKFSASASRNRSIRLPRIVMARAL